MRFDQRRKTENLKKEEAVLCPQTKKKKAKSTPGAPYVGDGDGMDDHEVIDMFHEFAGCVRAQISQIIWFYLQNFVFIFLVAKILPCKDDKFWDRFSKEAVTGPPRKRNKKR